MSPKSPVVRMQTCFSHPKREATHWMYMARYEGKFFLKAGWCSECEDTGEPEVLMDARDMRVGFGTVARSGAIVVGDLLKAR